MRSLGYVQTVKQIYSTTGTCDNSIGGVFGTAFLIRGYLTLSCIVCKEVV